MAGVYRTDLVTLYCGKAEEILPTLGRKTVDCLVTDPPYGQEWDSSFRVTKFGVLANDDGSLDLNGIIEMCFPLFTNNGKHLYVFGPCDLSPLPLCSPVQLIWDKRKLGMGDLTLPWARAHEPITFAVWWPLARKSQAGRGNLSAKLRKGSVLSVPALNAVQVRRHPTEKPVALMRQLIESSTNHGETVLDPFAGVGSTLVAAVLEGRKAVGIEIDPGYATIAMERLKLAEANVRSQEKL